MIFLLFRLHVMIQTWLLGMEITDNFFSVFIYWWNNFMSRNRILWILLPSEDDEVWNTALDLTKAYDTLNHEVLLKKFSFYGIRGITNLWFESYLTNRRQCVEINQSDLFFFIFHSVNPYKVIDNLQDIEHVILLMLSRYRISI